MKNKKALLALSLVLVLGASLIAGGTLAWFSDTDEVTNTFTVGSVEIVQNETNADGTEFNNCVFAHAVSSNCFTSPVYGVSSVCHAISR